MVSKYRSAVILGVVSLIPGVATFGPGVALAPLAEELGSVAVDAIIESAAEGSAAAEANAEADIVTTIASRSTLGWDAATFAAKLIAPIVLPGVSGHFFMKELGMERKSH